MPTFSVIIPTYNSEKFITDTVKSVLTQTFKDFELIIVDDGSRDATKQIITDFKISDPRIKLITSSNSGGPTVPTNIGLNVARGKYIAFLDHDDSWKKNKLEELYKEFTAHDDIGFILSNVDIYSELENTTNRSVADIKDKKLSNDKLLAGKYFNTFSMISIKRNILDRIGSLDTNLFVFADYDIIARMVSYSIPHTFLNDALVTYRIHQHNASSLDKSAERRAKDLERIITKYGKTFDLYKKSRSNVHHAIGRIYLYLGDKKSAVTHFKKAVSYDPYNPTMYLRLLMAYVGERPYNMLKSLRRKATRTVS